jgi:hypothetical protein
MKIFVAGTISVRALRSHALCTLGHPVTGATRAGPGVGSSPRAWRLSLCRWIRRRYAIEGAAPDAAIGAFPNYFGDVVRITPRTDCSNLPPIDFSGYPDAHVVHTRSSN